MIHKAPWVFSTIWNLITPLLDPVVASKIHFTRDLKELTNYIELAALPGFISGDTKKKTLDEATDIEPVMPGTLATPTTPAYQDYQDMIKEFQIETTEWTKKKSTEEGDNGVRHELAKQYRHARVKAEKDIRGPTGYQAKGLVTISPKGRVILNYGSEGWVPLDITDMV